MSSLSILVVDDESLIREELRDFLQRRRNTVLEAGDAEAALVILEHNSVDVVILDITLPNMSGLDALRRIKEVAPQAEVIMITGLGDTDVVLDALRGGAFDFFHKPLSLAAIQASIERTARFVGERRRAEAAERRCNRLSDELREHTGTTIVAESKPMLDVLSLAGRAAEQPDTPVLITGETGTGKELVARLIHLDGRRGQAAFCVINCPAIPEALAESEFFGHRKGAFTHAVEDRAGFFEDADGGTIFLDEIGDLPPAQQAKILRVLEDGRVKRVGSNREVAVDVRVIAATNRDLGKLAREDRYRLDLFYRLNAFTIHIPPLRERIDDIGPLVRYFTAFFGPKRNPRVRRVDEAVITHLQRYSFPGNVRELRNLVERALILCETDVLTPDLFAVDMSLFTESAEITPAVENALPVGLDLTFVERQAIVRALAVARNNKSEAASLLGITRFALMRKMAKHKL